MADELVLYFKSESSGFQVRAEDSTWRAFATLDAARPSFDDLFKRTPDRLPKLIRVIAEEGQELPPISFWNFQRKQRTGWSHIMDQGIVVVECRRTSGATWTGDTLVVDAPELGAGLQLGSCLTVTMTELERNPQMLSGSILIGGPAIEGEAVDRLAGLAYYHDAAAVIWCAPEARSTRPIVEVRTSGEALSTQLEIQWIKAFLMHLRARNKPSSAMLAAYKATSQLKMRPDARWLCEDLEGRWDLALPAPSVPLDWRSSVDRFSQGAMVDLLHANLRIGSLATRVQIVVAPGSKHSCLGHFVSRFVRREMFVEWGEDPDCQFENVARQLRRRDVEEPDTQKFINYVFEMQESSAGSSRSSGNLIPSIAHHPIQLGEVDADTLPLASLRRYLGRLAEVAQGLANLDLRARLVVHLPIVLEGTIERHDLKRALKGSETRFLRIAVLPLLSDRMPTDELAFWLESYDLNPDRIEGLDLDQPYETLLDQIRERYALQD